MKYPLYCTSKGKRLDSGVAKLCRSHSRQSLLAPRKDGVNTLAAVVAAGGDQSLSGSSSAR